MKQKRPRVAVFFGGKSANRDLSLETGYWMCQYIPRSQYDVVPIEVTEDGKWKVPLGSLPRTGPVGRVLQMLSRSIPALSPMKALERLADKPVFNMLTALRGEGGDDGSLHSIGQLIDSPVAGSSPDVCHIAHNKHLFSRYAQDVASTPDAKRFSANTPTETIVQDIQSSFLPPIMIKPAFEEGSIGSEIVTMPDELAAAIHRVKTLGGDILVQQKQPGVEIAFTLVNDGRGGMQALAPTVIKPRTASFYDSLAKRKAGRATIHAEHSLDDPLIHRAAYIAKDIYEHIGCKGLVTVDMIAQGNRIDVLEVNTVPVHSEFTPLKHQIASSNVHPSALLDRMIQLP